MSIHNTVYEANKSYADNIQDTLNKYMDQHGYKTRAEFLQDFNKSIPDSPVAPSTFRVWLKGNSIPNLYYLVKLADFMRIDIYDLIYNRRGVDE